VDERGGDEVPILHSPWYGSVRLRHQNDEMIESYHSNQWNWGKMDFEDDERSG
jgi:hypothetical protein